MLETFFREVNSYDVSFDFEHEINASEVHKLGNSGLSSLFWFRISPQIKVFLVRS